VQGTHGGQTMSHTATMLRKTEAELDAALARVAQLQQQLATANAIISRQAMTTTTARITAAIAGDSRPIGPRWLWYSRIAAAAGCSSQSVYLHHRRAGFLPAVEAPTVCRGCGGAVVGGAHGYCRGCCVRFGGRR